MKVIYCKGRHEYGTIRTSFFSVLAVCFRLMRLGWNIKLRI